MSDSYDGEPVRDQRGRVARIDKGLDLAKRGLRALGAGQTARTDQRGRIVGVLPQTPKRRRGRAR